MEALDVDEVVGQLLASEGFASVEELAMSTRRNSPASKASTRTPRASCRRARANISRKIEAELDAKRKELGVDGRAARRFPA